MNRLYIPFAQPLQIALIGCTLVGYAPGAENLLTACVLAGPLIYVFLPVWNLLQTPQRGQEAIIRDLVGRTALSLPVWCMLIYASSVVGSAPLTAFDAIYAFAKTAVTIGFDFPADFSWQGKVAEMVNMALLPVIVALYGLYLARLPRA